MQDPFHGVHMTENWEHVKMGDVGLNSGDDVLACPLLIRKRCTVAHIVLRQHAYGISRVLCIELHSRH